MPQVKRLTRAEKILLDRMVQGRKPGKSDKPVLAKLHQRGLVHQKAEFKPWTVTGAGVAENQKGKPDVQSQA